jgi:hypothetical protein
VITLSTPACSGDCPVGRYCTEGSIVPVRRKGTRAAVGFLMKDPGPAEPELALCCVSVLAPAEAVPSGEVVERRRATVGMQPRLPRGVLLSRGHIQLHTEPLW